MTWAGDNSLVWGITLEADLEADASDALDRVSALPLDAEVTDGGAMELASTPFTTPIRVSAVGHRLVIAAHHESVDGLGLLGVLGVLLGTEVRSRARGLDDRPSRPFVRTAVGRLAEAAFAPPAAVAFTGPRSTGADNLSTVDVPAELASARLMSASVSAIQAWNTAHSSPASPLAIAVGASRRAGDAPTIEDASAYLRLRIDGDLSPAEAATRLRAAPPEPGADRVPGQGPLGSLAARVSRRLGSTALVSHLGTVTAPGVRRLAFSPVTGGRSGVSIGAVTMDGTSTLTLRCRPGTLSDEDRAELLGLVVTALG